MGRRRNDSMFYGPVDGIEELAVLTAVLDVEYRTNVFVKLAALFGDDFAAFMAVFQGAHISVPSRTVVEAIAFHARVWVYVRSQGGGARAIAAAARRFDLPEGKVEAICGEIQDVLETGKRRRPRRKKKKI